MINWGLETIGIGTWKIWGIGGFGDCKNFVIFELCGWGVGGLEHLKFRQFEHLGIGKLMIVGLRDWVHWRIDPTRSLGLIWETIWLKARNNLNWKRFYHQRFALFAGLDTLFWHWRPYCCDVPLFRPWFVVTLMCCDNVVLWHCATLMLWYSG